MTHVFRLKATGKDGFTGVCERTVETTTVFASREIAESRIEKFVASLLAQKMMDPEQSIEVEVILHEIIYS